MAINIGSELQRLYDQSKQRESSLTERLNAMDSYAGQVNPVVRAQMTDFSNRPAGYNPLQDLQSAVEFAERSRDARSGASEDLGRVQQTSLDLLSQLDELSQRSATQSPEDKFMETLKLEAAKQQIKEGTLKYNPKTGELTIADSDDTAGMIEQKIAGLKIADRNSINDLTGAVGELAKLNKSFADVVGNTDDVGSLFKGATGPLAKLLGSYVGSNAKEKELRTAIQTFQDQIRKDLFGSAFTQTEKQNAQLPDSGKQEATNRRIISSLYDSKAAKLKQTLVNAGLSDGEADTYIKKLSGSAASTSSSKGGKRPPLSSFEK